MPLDIARTQVIWYKGRGGVINPHSFLQAVKRHPVVLGFYFNANAAPPGSQGREAGCCGAGKRIENGVTGKAEHSKGGLDQLQRIRRWVCTSRCSPHGYDLAEPFAM